jgi:hypothetical protein
LLSLAEVVRFLKRRDQVIFDDPKHFLLVMDSMMFHLAHVEHAFDLSGTHKLPTLVESLDWNNIKKQLHRLQEANELSPERQQAIYVIQKNIKTIRAIATLLPDLDYTLSNQDWFMERMAAVGYNPDKRGQCFGMANMGMQAFLADDMSTFDARLESIAKISVQAFKHDFKQLKIKRQDYLDDGNTKRADEITAMIINTWAFFDGIALYQTPTDHKPIFRDEEHNTGEAVLGQDEARTRNVVLPATLDAKAPAKISTYSGSYTPFELTTHLKALKRNLGEHSFSLLLGGVQHAINLNYNAKTKRWLLIDPNRLPGVEYMHEDLLSKALIAGFHQEKGLVIETSLYARHSDAASLGKDFSSMVKSKPWRHLHRQSKLNTLHDDTIPQLHHAIWRKDYPWVKKNIPAGLKLDAIPESSDALSPLMLAVNMRDLKMIRLLLENKTPINQHNDDGNTALMGAAVDGQPEVVNYLLEQNADAALYDNDGVSALMLAAEEGHVAVTTLLFNKSKQPTNTLLSEIAVAGNLAVIHAFVNDGITSMQAMLELACHAEALEAAKKLAPLVASDIISNMNLRDIFLHEIGVPEKIVDDAIETIKHHATGEITSDTIKTFDEPKLRAAILKHTKTLVYDKSSRLGADIQHRKNPRLDTMLGLEPKKFSNFKKKFQTITTNEQEKKDLPKSKAPKSQGPTKP